jgi:hypothetical protein
MKNLYRTGKGAWKKIKGAYDLFPALRDFFSAPITLAQAEEQVKTNLATREERFLALARSQVYERPGSPYLNLLKLAGCEFSDLRTSVRRYGLEETLVRLAQEGVYLTSDEFKGKKEVTRRGQSFRVSPEDFNRPNAPPGIVGHSSGTSNRPASFMMSLDWIATRAFATAIFLRAHDLLSASHALYDAILPAAAVDHLLANAKMGRTTDRWFARKVPSKSRLSYLHHSLITHEIVFSGRWFGPGFPKPEFIGIPDIHRIIEWIVEQRRLKRTCLITTVTSSAARVCRAAAELGASLEGAKFYVAGEPFTEAKEAAIEKVGASAVSRYSYGGGIPVGYGCANPFDRDEVHVNKHLLAIISHPNPLTYGAQLIRPLLLTTLHPTAPRFLLNVENGDYATLLERRCGCALEEAGLTLHLHRIRSFEKFTSEGMNYFYGDLFELFETILPAEFGGGPGDYQLVEEEDSNGQTRLSLRVHPDVPNLNERRLVSRLEEELGRGHWENQFRMNVWRDAGTLRVKREVPHTSLRGKNLPLHIDRSSR